jgi:peptidoglycan/LPS O-acetylase OafA/YrhL
MRQQISPIPRFFSLDAARGLAAISVVFYHWGHMYRIGAGTPNSIPDRPGYSILFPFYESGWIAVEMFFSISGFVFFWLYSESVNAGNMSGRSFFALRFSRLYPLHFATLMIVAAGEMVYHHYANSYYVYSLFNWRTFFSNLFMVQSWKLGTVESFNGPSWSVSIEVLLYLVFFFLCRYFDRFLILAVICLMVSGLAISPIAPDVGRGLCSFFAGGLVYRAYSRIGSAPALRRTFVIAATIAISGWVLTLFEIRYGYIEASTNTMLTRLPGSLTANEVHKLLVLPVRLILIPLSVFALIAHEALGATVYRRFAVLGDISYSSYLIHFPLQLMIAIFVVSTAGDPHVFQSGAFMTLFIAVLLAVSLLSHRWFEMPLQRVLRLPSASASLATAGKPLELAIGTTGKGAEGLPVRAEGP